MAGNCWKRLGGKWKEWWNVHFLRRCAHSNAEGLGKWKRKCANRAPFRDIFFPAVRWRATFSLVFGWINRRLFSCSENMTRFSFTFDGHMTWQQRESWLSFVRHFIFHEMAIIITTVKWQLPDDEWVRIRTRLLLTVSYVGVCWTSLEQLQYLRKLLRHQWRRNVDPNEK